MTQGGRLKNHEVQHVVHTDDIEVSRTGSYPLLNPKETFLWEAATDNKLDSFHFFEFLLIVLCGKLRSQFFVV